MRQAVMRLGDADLRIAAAVQLAAVHQREDAGQIALDTPATASRTAASHDRRTAPGCRSADPAPAASSCCSALPPSESGARPRGPHRDIRRPSRGRPARASCCSRARSLVDAIEQAALLLHPVEPLFRRAAFAEQPLEHDARIVLDRQRRRRRLPRHRVHVGAAVAGLALAAEDEIDLRRDHLHRRQHGFLAELRRSNLIGGRRQPDVGAFRLLRMDAVRATWRTRACARRCRRPAIPPASARGR